MSEKISKDPSDFLQVRVEIPPPVREIRFTVPEPLKAGTLKALEDIRALFGSKGQYWITGDAHQHLEVGDDHPDTGRTLTKELNRYCLIGGVKAVDGAYEGIARAAIALAILEYEGDREERLDEVEDEDGGYSLQDELLDDDHIINFNDGKTTFKDICAVLKLARKLVESA